MELTWVAVAAVFLLASFVKGTTGMGFPLIATPMVALLVDIKTAYAVLVLPNILMDMLQILRGRLPWALWRRLFWLLGTTVVGVFLGTRILISVPERVVYLALALLILAFLGSRYLRIRLRVLARWERWLGPVGRICGWNCGRGHQRPRSTHGPVPAGARFREAGLREGHGLHHPDREAQPVGGHVPLGALHGRDRSLVDGPCRRGAACVLGRVTGARSGAASDLRACCSCPAPGYGRGFSPIVGCRERGSSALAKEVAIMLKTHMWRWALLMLLW